jgi:hypothetical protein
MSYGEELRNPQTEGGLEMSSYHRLNQPPLFDRMRQHIETLIMIRCGQGTGQGADRKI